MMRVENWCGHNIRFIDQNGEWWAILKDICDALDLRTDKVAERLDPEMMLRVKVDQDSVPGLNVLSNANRSKIFDPPSKGVRSRGDNKTRWMLAVNEIGIYEALFSSRRLEARKFRRWSATVMQKLRRNVGLEGYEVMKMTDPEIQADIDNILNTLFYDEKTGVLMQSITVKGGDVDQFPFFDN